MTQRFTKGEIWLARPSGARPERYLIVSGMLFNRGTDPQVVSIQGWRGKTAEEMPDTGEWLILTNPTDPIKGALFMEYLSPVWASELVKCEGRMGGATMEKVDRALREIFKL